MLVFDRHPSRYRHWKLSFDGPVATLAMDVDEAGGLVEGEHRVKIDLGRGGEDRPRVRVPARYLDFSKSRLTVRVPTPDNRVVIELDPR